MCATVSVVDLTNDDMISLANATNLISNTSLTLTSVSIRSAGHYKAVFDDDNIFYSSSLCSVSHYQIWNIFQRFKF